MEEKLNELNARVREISDIQSAVALLSWDQTTYMPPGGAAARGRQVSLLSRLAQEKMTDPELGQLLENLAPFAKSLPEDDDRGAIIRVTRRQYDRAVRIPPALIAELFAHASDSYVVWAKARPEADFAAVEANLEKTLDLSRQVAECFEYEHIADPLIDLSDYGMKAETVRNLFAELRRQLVPLVEAITTQAPTNDGCLHQQFPEEAQLDFGKSIIVQYGYDFERGRQDKTHHPFMTKFSLGDVRITTRVKENDLSEALFSTLHEAGHAMYEQGIKPAYEGTFLAGGTSAGVHESQSRLWENLVGRSLPFWEHYYPQLQQTFPAQFNQVSLDTFYRAVNKVQHSLVRTDADEVTYNLHVMIRFDLELALLEGTLAVKNLPDAWHSRYESDLGVRAPDEQNGVLQDVHWYAGLIGGAFQGYTLGNIMSALFYEQALAAHPQITTEIGQGEFGTLHSWLKDNIYQHGSKYTASELIERLTGNSLSIEPYMRYLHTKFGDLYDL